MNRFPVVIFCTALILPGCAGIIWQRPPAFTLDVAPAFNYAVKSQLFKRGDILVDSDPDSVQADVSTTRTSGSWGPLNGKSTDHGWSVEVTLQGAPRVQCVLNACNHARNGYEAKVDEIGSYMFARFERRTFAWGRAFTYLTQFTQDTSLYVPHNGHLIYEVWGVTNDLRHVVHANFFITHHKLAEWGPKVRDARSIENLKNDRDYKLVESCKPSAFEPSLTEIDHFINSLALK